VRPLEGVLTSKASPVVLPMRARAKEESEMRPISKRCGNMHAETRLHYDCDANGQLIDEMDGRMGQSSANMPG